MPAVACPTVKPWPRPGVSAGYARMTAPLLELRGIRKRFHATTVLDGVDLEVRAGEVHALVGANGAGKSTLIKILAGAYERDGGEILLDGDIRRIQTPRDALNLGIGVIYQEFQLVPELSVAENLLLGQEPLKRFGPVRLVDRRALVKTAREHLDRLGFSLDAARPVRTLGTGERQLVEIARALYRNARVLVLDEPTAALSSHEVERLFSLIDDLRQRGLALIYISHHLEEVFHVGDRISALRDGRKVATWSRGMVTEDELIHAMVGREVVELDRPPSSAAGEEQLRAEALSGPGFSKVDLSLHRGQITAITGAAGAGHTEVCRVLAGSLPRLDGRIKLAGQEVRWRAPRDAVRAGVLMAPGDRKGMGIVPGRSVAVNLTFADLRTRGPFIDAPANRREALARIERYGIRCLGPDQEAQSLSGGNQQKVVVGRVAARGASVYLFDEPTRGVDVGAREEIYALIHRLAGEGAAICVSTPDLQEALRLGDRIGVMRGGRLVAMSNRADTDETALLSHLLGASPGKPE